MTAFETASALARRAGLTLLVGLAAAHLASACNDRTTKPEACYAEDHDWGFTPGPAPEPLGFCQWSYEDLTRTEDGHIQGIPDAPPNVPLMRLIYCFDLDDGQVCDACPAEETDALLREYFAETVCDEEITYFERGCYYLMEGEALAEYEQQIVDHQLEVDHETGRSRCCYKAIIAHDACPEDDG